MPPRERPIDRANRTANSALRRLGEELREARLDRGLTVDAASAAAGISNAELSRIERARSPRVPFVTLARCGAIVGLDLVPRLYPGGSPVRDAGHAELVADFRTRLHATLRWATEVPLPIMGDQRAWDAVVGGRGWTYGVEAETAPRDAQALARRIQLKRRDGGVDGAILVLRASRRTAAFLREAADELLPSFPIPGRRALELLGAGADPGGNAIVVQGRRRGLRVAADSCVAGERERIRANDPGPHTHRVRSGGRGTRWEPDLVTPHTPRV